MWRCGLLEGETRGVMERQLRPLVAPLVIFVTLLLFYACFDDVDGRANAGDNLWYIPTAMSIFADRDIDLAEFQEPLRKVDPGRVWLTDMGIDPRLHKADGQVRNWYPIGTSLVCLPLVPAGHALYYSSWAKRPSGSWT